MASAATGAKFISYLRQPALNPLSQAETHDKFCNLLARPDLHGEGLWDTWTNPQGKVIETCTILTTTPNSLLGDVHDRMPVILSPDNYDLWLDPAFRNTASVAEMLRPFEATMMRGYPVSTRVNQVQNDDADCANPLEFSALPAQSLLF
jgi:putative SOS response-associated peptidase YedK